MARDDKEIIKLTCSRCGAPIEIKYGTYRRTRNEEHLCRSCRGKAESGRIKNMDPDERKEFLDKRNQAVSRGWAKQSSEKKKEISKMRKEMWKSEERHEKHSKMLHDRWADMSEEAQKERVQKMLEGQATYWSDPGNKEYHSNRARTKWFNQSPEEQQRILAALNKGKHEFWDNISEEDKARVYKHLSESLRKYWGSLDEPQHRNLDHKNLFPKGPNKNEVAFINELNKFNINYDYQYHSKIKHPDFDKLFPSNPVKPGVKISPYHVWDFIAHLYDQDMLIDIDGSIHDPEKTNHPIRDSHGNKYLISDSMSFKESQRPYQTDGMSAYIVQCYDDNLGPDTPVVNVRTGEKIKLNKFILLLRSLSMSDKDLKKLLDS